MGQEIWQEDKKMKRINLRHRYLLVTLSTMFAVGLGLIYISVHKSSFANCAEAKTYGQQDILKESDYYQHKLDRDSDGVACER